MDLAASSPPHSMDLAASSPSDSLVDSGSPHSLDLAASSSPVPIKSEPFRPYSPSLGSTNYHHLQHRPGSPAGLRDDSPSFGRPGSPRMFGADPSRPIIKSEPEACYGASEARRIYPHPADPYHQHRHRHHLPPRHPEEPFPHHHQRSLLDLQRLEEHRPPPPRPLQLNPQFQVSSQINFSGDFFLSTPILGFNMLVLLFCPFMFVQS